MKLHAENPIVFDLFFHGLYTQSLWDKSADKNEWPDMSNLLKLYIFADMARIPSLMNQCLDTVKWISDALVHIPSYEIPRVWENTITGGPIRRFLIDSLVWKSKSEALSGILPTLPDDARLELTIAMKQVIESFETTKTTAQVVRPLWKMSNCHVPEDSKEPPK
jgi:hypothetical protein